jgi:hypothetical protein
MEIGAQAAAPAEDLLAPPRTGEDGRLRRIDVAVTWQDGEREERVTRTTFAFDTTGLESLFPEKGTGASGADAGEGGDGGEAAATGQTGKSSSKKQPQQPTQPFDPQEIVE